MYNRQLHEEEGELIRKKASIYAERQGISIADAQPSSLDRRSARRIRRRQSGLRRTAAHEHFLPRSPGLQGSGFAYFDGKADGSYDNSVLFAGGVDSATLTTLYDAAGSGHKPARQSPRF